MGKSIASIPLRAARIARSGSGRLATALSARALAVDKLERVQLMAAYSDRIVAVCSWLFDALLANGVPRDKIVLNRQGLEPLYLKAAHSTPRTERQEGAPLQLLYLGRWDRVKGIDVVVHAILRLAKSVKVELTIRALPTSRGDGSYESYVRELASRDDRVRIDEPVSRGRLAETLAQYDAMVVPSLWMETGPLVVLEAQAAGLFVLGSDRGGIAELIRSADQGELVPAGDADSWAEAIQRLAVRRNLGTAKSAYSPVRSMETVAADMLKIYQSI